MASLDFQRINQEVKKQDEDSKSRLIKDHFADLYSSNTHFVFELLQNAEDALKRHPAEWQGSRLVSVLLTEKEVRFQHSGVYFTEDDIVAICALASSTKTMKNMKPSDVSALDSNQSFVLLSAL